MDTKSVGRATIVTVFKVRSASGSERTYNNGLCQIRLEFEIVTDAPLSREEIATLTILDANTKQLIPVIKDDEENVPVPQGTWGCTRAKNDYDFYSPGLEIEPQQTKNYTEFQHYYVQTADFANARKTIGARIKLENNREFFSAEINSADGKIDLIPVAPANPPFSAWNQDWEQTYKFSVGANVNVTIYYLGIVLPSGARLGIKTMEVAPASFASTFKWLSPNSQSGAFCGYAVPPDDPQPTSPFVYSQEQFTGNYRVSKNDWPRYACGAIAFVSNNSLGPFQAGANGQGCTYLLRDQYGTPYRVRVAITPECDALTLSQA